LGGKLMAEEKAFPVRRPQPNRAKRLVTEAHQLCLQQRFEEALPLVERAIRCDQINALNDYITLRSVIAEQLGDSKPLLAIRFYNHAKLLQRQGRFRDLRVAYLESFRRDRRFLWPFNNYAWLLATSKNPSVRDGREALRYAKLACRRSHYNCWAFISTLAAAYAELGYFKKAIGWQSAAMTLVPADHMMDSIIQLRHYQSEEPYIDEGAPVAAGGENA
jgi:tetratricopeptide (TPR) repeat protein